MIHLRKPMVASVLFILISAGSLPFVLSAALILFFALRDVVLIFRHGTGVESAPSWREVRMKLITACFILTLPAAMWVYFMVQKS